MSENSMQILKVVLFWRLIFVTLKGCRQVARMVPDIRSVAALSEQRCDRSQFVLLEEEL